MAQHTIKRGLDVPIQGVATGPPVELPLPATIAYAPLEFGGITPRPAAREGDVVRRGSPLFYHKLDADLQFLSPIAGRVREIRRGLRRVITDVIIERTDEAGEVEFRQWSAADLASITRDAAITGVKKGGLWPHLRTRPLNKVADSDRLPQAILIAATETGPLQPGADILIAAGDKEALQAGVHVLKAMTDGPVHLTVPPKSHPALSGIEGVEVHTFAGPHPAGDPAVQVNFLCPPRGPAGVVWTIRAWDVVLIGRLFLEGRYPAERIYAAVGAGAKQPRFVKTVLGAPLEEIVGPVAEGSTRWIRGSVLTGEAVDRQRWASFYTRAVHVLPEEVHRVLFGWMTPRFDAFSVYRAFLSGFLPASKPVDMRPGMYGGHRAMIPIGQYASVVPSPDIQPDFLFRSIVAGDLDESIKLGLLDLSEEEAALCTYVCPSKIEFDVLLREGLAQYEKEM